MKTILSTYPDFQSLPKGLKQLLVASESFYFGEARPAAAEIGELKDGKVPQFFKAANFNRPLVKFAPA